jgi:hypothetical protein
MTQCEITQRVNAKQLMKQTCSVGCGPGIVSNGLLKVMQRVKEAKRKAHSRKAERPGERD